MTTFHKGLATGRWQTMTLMEQLANISSELHRALAFQRRPDDRFENARDRTIELLDLSVTDPRWRGRGSELARFREVCKDVLFGAHEYHMTGEQLEAYLLWFALRYQRSKQEPLENLRTRQRIMI